MSARKTRRPELPTKLKPVPLRARAAIRWRHRKVTDRDTWLASVAFDEIMWHYQWAEPTNFDDRLENYT